MKEVLYRGRQKTVHDIRIIEILNTAFKVIEIFGMNIHFPQKKLSDNSICIFGPLTDIWPALDVTEKPKTIIGLSWGYDLISEIKEERLFQIAKNNISKCKKIIVDTKTSEKILRSQFGFSGEILNVPYGCDVDYFSSLQKSELRSNNIGIFRNWKPIYNNKFILDTLLNSKLNYENTINVAGEGEEKMKAINALRIARPTIKIDIYESTFDSYSQAISNSGIYISAANVDGTSITLLEAMSASIIPLVPNTQTNREWIINNKNGFMYKQNNAKDLTIKLSEILSLNSNQRKDITSVALETVKKRANWKLNSHKFLNFIEEPV